MKGNLLKFSMLLMVVIVFFSPTFVGADTFMKEKIHTDGVTIMGHAQPPQDNIATVWIAKDKMRRDMGDMSSIVKLDNNKILIYDLNHGQKAYTEFSLGSSDLQDAASAMAADVQVKITPTREKKKIGNWTCMKYLQEMNMGGMPMTSEIWATEDIKIPHYDLYEKLSTAMMTQQPGMKKAVQAMQKEMKKIKGVPVLTLATTTMMKNTTVKSSRELLEVKEESAPAGTFDIPPGYTKQAMPQAFDQPKMPGKQKPK
jgi:hypothetical protein